MLTSHDNCQVPLLHYLFVLSLLSYHLICGHEHMQRCAATVCASMGASVGRDLRSFVTVLQGLMGPAASMVSTDKFALYHVQCQFYSSLF